MRCWSGIAGVLAIVLAGCTPAKLAEGRVRSALMDAGLSQPNAACMADRMTDRLTLGQLRKLQALQALVADAKAALEALTPDEVNSFEGKDVVFKLGERAMPFTAEGFLQELVARGAIEAPLA